MIAFAVAEILKYVIVSSRPDMQVHRSLQNLPSFTNSVITIGTFDGVHEGHKKIINALIKEARAVNGESIIITFHPHPRTILRPGQKIQLINTLEEKIELLRLTTIDHLVIVPFTQEFATLSAKNYIENFLIKFFKPHSIIIGYDHHFGKDRKGDFTLLQAMAGTFKYNLLEIPKHVLNEIDVSSTKIRNAIIGSDIDTANNLLGYNFYFEGTVVKGDQLGRKLGYPTANLEYTDPEKIKLGHGVFAVYIKIGDRLEKGMLSIGNRPTLANSEEKIEVNIFGWNEEIYGTRIKVFIKKFLRPQEKYNSLDELVKQLELDKINSLAVL